MLHDLHERISTYLLAAAVLLPHVIRYLMSKHDGLALATLTSFVVLHKTDPVETSNLRVARVVLLFFESFENLDKNCLLERVHSF